MGHLRDNVPGYYNRRADLVEVASYLAGKLERMPMRDPEADGGSDPPRSRQKGSAWAHDPSLLVTASQARSRVSPRAAARRAPLRPHRRVFSQLAPRAGLRGYRRHRASADRLQQRSRSARLSAARSAAQQAMALKEKWNERPPEAESLLDRDRYQKLHELLMRGNLAVRVVGRADLRSYTARPGSSSGRDGIALGLHRQHQRDPAGLARALRDPLGGRRPPRASTWVEDEFEHLWDAGDSASRRHHRRGRPLRSPDGVPARRRLCLPMRSPPPPWRRLRSMPRRSSDAVAAGVRHDLPATPRDVSAAVRLLLADEVGVGKTLSLAAAAVLASLLGDGPVLILCPATLTQQWQVELWDKLGVPSAVWSSNKKTWLDHNGHPIRTRGAEDVARCPYQIGIVSTGLVFQPDRSATHLLRRRYGTLVLDEAHRARRAGGTGREGGRAEQPAGLHAETPRRGRAISCSAPRTPIQTDVSELWDLLEILGCGADHVLGRSRSHWRSVRSMSRPDHGRKRNHG